MIHGSYLTKTMVDKIRKCSFDFHLTGSEAGISRSSGMAGALSRYFKDDDSEFFTYPYLPNRHVYVTLLNHLNGKSNVPPSVVSLRFLLQGQMQIVANPGKFC